MGTNCNSPRECFRVAYKMNWINDTDPWFEAMEARNRTSHIYHVEIAKEVFAVAKKFPHLVRPLIAALKEVIS